MIIHLGLLKIWFFAYRCVQSYTNTAQVSFLDFHDNIFLFVCLFDFYTAGDVLCKCSTRSMHHKQCCESGLEHLGGLVMVKCM